MILVSPTELKQPIIQLLADLGCQAISSSKPEQHGADFLMSGQPGWVAVQRKESGDFINSIEDGRLQREVSLLCNEPVPILILEGWPDFTTDGQHLDRPRWDKRGFRNLLRSVSREGIQIERTDDLADTATALVELLDYWQKPAHLALLTMPKRIKTDSFGRKIAGDRAAWVLQAFEGIGPVIAERIVEKFGGAPLAWTCTVEELCEVEGVGKVLAVGLLGFLRAEKQVETC